MRNKLLTASATALLLASTTLAWAEDKPQPAPTPSNGILDIGGRFTSTTGDEARYERYRDLRDGVNANLLFSKETEKWTFDIKATNIGYRDQRYNLDFNSRRLRVSLYFDQTPINYAYYARTPYNCTAGDCSLDLGLRQRVEAGTAVGLPQTAAQLVTGSIYNTIAKTFDMQSRRDTFRGDARISATDNLDFTLGFNTYKKTGNMPWGYGFAFNNLQEIPLVIDNRETDVSMGVEWASHQGMFRASYERSKFDQNIPTFRWDNPWRATDFCRTGISGQAPGTCYDPSGYTNGNGPNDGLSAMPPTNSLNTFSWMGMVKLPGKTTANASFSAGSNRQNASLIGWTTNPVIANPTVYASFPELRSLPRDTADLHVNYQTATMNVSSRPHKDVTLTARYRYNGRSDFRRPFDGVEYVRFDAVPEETGGHSEPFSVDRNSVDFNAKFTVIPSSALKVGYGEDKLEHLDRATIGWKDKTARVSFDTVGNQYVTVRAQYAHTSRETIGFDDEVIIEMASQPATRFYDEAARKSDRATLMVDLTPTSSLGFNLSYVYGKDDYQKGDASQKFGLLDNTNKTYTAGVSFVPSEKVNMGADYGYESFDAFQASRTANPFSGVPGAYESWTDPNRDWNLTNDEKVKTFTAYLNLLDVVKKADIRATYEYSDSDQGFVHGGPRITAMQNNSILTAGDSRPCATGLTSCFTALPNVTSTWQHLTIDFKYNASKKVGLGLTYWYEKFKIQDYATINTAGPQTLPVAALGPQTDTARIDWLGSLNTGYGNRPYTGNTFFVRMFYLF
ncbi:MAG: MtrB/PioB family outer membrane beta-barrel protein [Vicinamibacteria bacterium]|nr:MtrB/PioB family outer membrane beta-barrel protein [Vicinamibacteria bacterium]